MTEVEFKKAIKLLEELIKQIEQINMSLIEMTEILEEKE